MFRIIIISHSDSTICSFLPDLLLKNRMSAVGGPLPFDSDICCEFYCLLLYLEPTLGKRIDAARCTRRRSPDHLLLLDEHTMDWIVSEDSRRKDNKVQCMIQGMYVELKVNDRKRFKQINSTAKYLLPIHHTDNLQRLIRRAKER